MTKRATGRGVRWALVLGWALLVSAGLFAGCDDSAGRAPGGPCQRHSDCLDGEYCDGALLVCRPQDDFKPPSDATDPPDTTIIWQEDTLTTDVDTGADPDTTDTSPAECEPGEVRECGIAQGECTIGEQTCEAGNVWSECSGQGPVPEECDGLDNDCNGVVDDRIVRECGVNTGICISGVGHGTIRDDAA
jgi:hypothetical protein